MKRFSPLAKPHLAIVPIRNADGHVVDAAVTAVMAEPDEPDEVAKRRSKHATRNTHNVRPAYLKVAVITLSENKDRGGIELRFPTKPNDAIREELKAAGGWRWSSFSGCWYTKDTPEKRAWATAFIARHAQAAAPSKISVVVDPADQVAKPTNIIHLPILSRQSQRPPQPVPASASWRRRLL